MMERRRWTNSSIYQIVVFITYSYVIIGHVPETWFIFSYGIWKHVQFFLPYIFFSFGCLAFFFLDGMWDINGGEVSSFLRMWDRMKTEGGRPCFYETRDMASYR